MDFKLRPYLAELLGTFVVVFVGAGTVCGSYRGETAAPWLNVAVALAEGCALAVAPHLLNARWPRRLPESGIHDHCFRVCKRLSGFRTIAFIVAQLIGAILAGLVVRESFGETTLVNARLGART